MVPNGLIAQNAGSRPSSELGRVELADLTKRTALIAELYHLTRAGNEVALVDFLQDRGLVADCAESLASCATFDLENCYKRLAKK